MPMIDVPPCVLKGDNASRLGVCDPAVNRRKGFGVFLFRQFGNGMIKLRFRHTLSLDYQFSRRADGHERRLR